MQQPLSSTLSSFPMPITQPSHPCSEENYQVLYILQDITFSNTCVGITSQFLPYVGPNQVPQAKIMLIGYEQYSS
eukprot:c4094_g1_i1 orf=167-391(-)